MVHDTDWWLLETDLENPSIVKGLIKISPAFHLIWMNMIESTICTVSSFITHEISFRIQFNIFSVKDCQIFFKIEFNIQWPPGACIKSHDFFLCDSLVCLFNGLSTATIFSPLMNHLFQPHICLWEMNFPPLAHRDTQTQRPIFTLASPEIICLLFYSLRRRVDRSYRQ